MSLHQPKPYRGRYTPVEPRKRYTGKNYHSVHRQGLYEICLKLAANPDSELYQRAQDGTVYRRTGASVRVAFWAGYEAAQTGVHNLLARAHPTSDCAACYAAGLDFGKAEKSLAKD